MASAKGFTYTSPFPIMTIEIGNTTFLETKNRKHNLSVNIQTYRPSFWAVWVIQKAILRSPTGPSPRRAPVAPHLRQRLAQDQAEEFSICAPRPLTTNLPSCNMNCPQSGCLMSYSQYFLPNFMDMGSLLGTILGTILNLSTVKGP